MKLLLAILLVNIAAGLGVLAVAAALWKLDHVTGAFADFNTFIFSAYALALATLLALCAWWLTDDAR